LSRLHQETTHSLRALGVKEKRFSVGTEVVASTPVEAAATIKSETDRIRKLINDAGLREQ
jgi:tripartite-type tricarboxylate transporter receptor subunit TctC